MATGDDTGDCTGFVVLMLTLIRESSENLLTATRLVTLTAANRLELAAQSFVDNSFSRKDCQAIFKTISTATASRDLQQGVKVKILERSGEKRTARYRFIDAGMSH